MAPSSRSKNLIVKELPDETLIYDRDTNKAHCLNLTTAIVWKLADGQRSVPELAALLSDKLGATVSENVVWLALDQLEQFNLLSEPVTRPTHLAGMTRRHLMRTLGIAAAVSIPAITSIIAPTAAQAASCGSLVDRDNGCPCSASIECASGCCRDGVCKPGGGGCV